MNRIHRNILVSLVTAAGMLATASAMAGEPARANYDNELERCISDIRFRIDSAGASQLRHRVVDVQQQGAYYLFQIETDRLDASEKPVASTVNSRCNAHRWHAATELRIENESSEGTRLAKTQ